MIDEADERGAELRKGPEGAHRQAQDILAEIERLRTLVAALETERLALLEKLESLADLFVANRALRALADSVQRENRRLREEQAHLQAELRSVRSAAPRSSSR